MFEMLHLPNILKLPLFFPTASSKFCGTYQKSCLFDEKFPKYRVTIFSTQTGGGLRPDIGSRMIIIRVFSPFFYIRKSTFGLNMNAMTQTKQLASLFGKGGSKQWVVWPQRRGVASQCYLENPRVLYN